MTLGKVFGTCENMANNESCTSFVGFKSSICTFVAFSKIVSTSSGIAICVLGGTFDLCWFL